MSNLSILNDPDGHDEAARREFRKEWMQIEEDEQIAEGDISVSETVDGKDPTPDLDETDEFENMRVLIEEQDDPEFD